MADRLAGIITLRHSNGTTTVGSAMPLKGQGHGYNHKFDVGKVSVNGDIVQYASSNPEEELTVEAIFGGTVLATLQAYALPTPLVVVTIAGLEPTIVSGTYNYGGLTITGKEGANVTVQIKLMRPGGGSLAVN